MHAMPWGPSASVRAWGPGACVCAGTQCLHVWGPGASVHAGTQCMCVCMGTRSCMHVWGHIACVRGDTLHACVGPGVRMRGTRCVRGDPAGMRRVWGQHMKGAFGVQNIVSEDEVESMYYLPYKPSTGA